MIRNYKLRKCKQQKHKNATKALKDQIEKWFLGMLPNDLQMLSNIVVQEKSGSFGHGAIAHSHSQRSVSGGFPLFKRCEWLVSN